MGQGHLNAKILRCNNLSELGDLSDLWCAQKIALHHARSMFIPAGNSPKALYQLWRAKSPAYLNGLELMQLDEIIEGAQMNAFQKFFNTELPGFQVTAVDSLTKVADLAILGVGVNGHVAFHEPGFDKNLVKEVVFLSESSCLEMRVPHGTRAMTYGLGAFLKVRAVLLLFVGEKKKPILEKFLTEEGQLPVQLLRDHPDLTVVTDL